MLNKQLLKRAITCIIVIVAAGAIISRCDKRKVKEITDEKLAPGERAAIIIDGHSGKVVEIEDGTPNRTGIRSPFLRGRKPESTRPNTETVTRTDGARGVRISIGTDGHVTVIARTKGLCFEPGIGIYSTADGSRLTLDSQLAFYRRHGFNAGLGTGIEKPRHLIGHIAYSYNFYSSTSLFIGVDSNKQILLGLRVKF